MGSDADAIWEKWWAIKTGLVFTFGIVFVVWFLWDLFRDIFRLVADLRTLDWDNSDDGTVSAEDHVQKLPLPQNQWADCLVKSRFC